MAQLQLQVQSTQPTLSALQQALDATEDSDASPIIPFIKSLDKFSEQDRPTALALLSSVFWTESPSSNSYTFTDKFKLLSAENLAVVVQRLGDKKVEQFIFVEHAKQLLSHYPVNDLVSLLWLFYSDRFANFVFNAFKGFLSAKLSLRIQYFKAVSVQAMIMILKEGGVGKSLSNDELILIASKIKRYLIDNQQTIDITSNTWLDCQQILPEIIQLLIGSNAELKSLTVQNLQTVLDNDLIVDMKQAKNIIHELLSRQKKSISTVGGAVDVKQKLNCERLVGVLSTDNFASFQQDVCPTNNNNNNNTNDNHNRNIARVLLDGPLVVIPMDKDAQNVNNRNKDVMKYSCLVQIQDLNPLFAQQNMSSTHRTQPKGSIFVILMHQIPNEYEVAISVSNVFDSSQIKQLNLGMNNKNPVCIIPWPLPKIGKAVSFRLHCELRPSQQRVDRIMYGISSLLGSGQAQNEQKSQVNENDNDGSSLWSMMGGGSKMVMCIHSGTKRVDRAFGRDAQQQQARLSWINVMVHGKMTFYDLLDAACAQLGLSPPRKAQQSQSQQQQQQVWPGGFASGFGGGQAQKDERQYYVVRNQMGHRCELDKNVVKYLDEMVMNSHLFPVFVFSASSEKQQQQRPQQQQQQQQYNKGGPFAGFGGNFSGLNFN